MSIREQGCSEADRADQDEGMIRCD